MLSKEIDLITWREPWSPVATEAHRTKLEAELQKEVAAGHVLHGRGVRALAVRADQDDVLFVVSDPEQLAVVHLSYSSGADHPPWPTTTLFDAVSQFVATRMDRDHDDYTFAG